MTRPFSWHQLRLRIPEDWEMSVYGVSTEFGSLEFSTLDGPMAALSWTRGKVRDAGELWNAEGSGATRTCGSPPCRWTWSFQEAAASERDAVVAATRFEAEMAYTLGPMRVRLPEGFRLKEVTAFPANLMLSAETPDRRRVVHRCWGLPDSVLAGEEEASFFRKLLQAGGLRVEATRRESFQGRNAIRMETSAAGLTPWQRLRFQRATGRGWIWREEETGRLRTFEQLAPCGAVPPEPEDCFE